MALCMGHIWTFFCRKSLSLDKLINCQHPKGMSEREENVYVVKNKVAHLFCSCLLRVVVVKCHVISKHPLYISLCKRGNQEDDIAENV